jgi:outer membrane protein OmpA-like peptidoglycan-associated protein
MKCFTILTAVCVVIFSKPLLAQIDEKGNSYFVVIGAFSIEKNATDFIQVCASKYALNPQYKMNASRNLFYVYTIQDKYWGIPVQEAERIRKLDSKFNKTWVYYGTLDAITQQPVVASTSTASILETPPPSLDNSVATVDSVGEVAEDPAKEVAKKFLFELKAEDGTQLKAPVELIDLDQSKLAALYPSNEPVVISPINNSGRVMVQTKVFGYRLKHIGLNLNSPLDSAGVILNDNVYSVPIVLKPLVMGDITIMYNVFFFKDAGIMRPDSKYEVNALVAMMQEHPHRKIVIHGHTNGNYRGRILKMGPKKDFFSTSGAVSENGSATELSEERAKCIQEYLVANGIDKSRMTIKAWGGKKMLHDTEHPRAIENVRVEVEIVKD